jgi:hypothetical protein
MRKLDLRLLPKEDLLELVQHLRVELDELNELDEYYIEIKEGLQNNINEAQLLLEEGHYLILNNEIIDFFEDLNEAKIAKEEYNLIKMRTNIVSISHEDI